MPETCAAYHGTFPIGPLNQRRPPLTLLHPPLNLRRPPRNLHHRPRNRPYLFTTVAKTVKNC